MLQKVFLAAPVHVFVNSLDLLVNYIVKAATYLTPVGVFLFLECLKVTDTE